MEKLVHHKTEFNLGDLLKLCFCLPLPQQLDNRQQKSYVGPYQLSVSSLCTKINTRKQNQLLQTAYTKRTYVTNGFVFSPNHKGTNNSCSHHITAVVAKSLHPSNFQNYYDSIRKPLVMCIRWFLMLQFIFVCELFKCFLAPKLHCFFYLLCFMVFMHLFQPVKLLEQFCIYFYWCTFLKTVHLMYVIFLIFCHFYCYAPSNKLVLERAQYKTNKLLLLLLNKKSLLELL